MTGLTTSKINRDAVPYATAVLFKRVKFLLNEAMFEGKTPFMCPPWKLTRGEVAAELQIELDDYLNACQRKTPSKTNGYTT